MKKANKGPDLFQYAHGNRPSIVYMATHRENGRRYIGITRETLKRRQQQHIASALRNAYPSSIFHRAIRKYGSDAFIFVVIKQCASYKDAALEEIRLIAELKPEYNASLGGDGVANIGTRMSPESVRKMVASKRKNPTRYWLGKKRPDIAEKQRDRLTGRPDLIAHMHKKAHTREAWDKASATKKARGITDKQRTAAALRRRPVICLNDDRVFSGASEAAKEIGCRYDSMVRVLTGKRRSIFGLHFAYLDKWEINGDHFHIRLQPSHI